MVKKRRARRWTLGEKLNAWRLEQGLSWAAVARRAGVKKSTLSNWVSAGVSPSADRFMPVAKLTGYPVEYWFDEALRWPPPADYLDASLDLEAAMSTMGVDELREWLRILSSPESRQRALALWRASEAGRS